MCSRIRICIRQMDKEVDEVIEVSIEVKMLRHFRASFGSGIARKAPPHVHANKIWFGA